jgi:hypothetical protein
MRNGVGTGLVVRPGAGTTDIDLAAERAELLPERMTLSVWEFDRQEWDPSNIPINSPLSRNFSNTGDAQPIILDSSGSAIENVINNENVVNQW